MTKPAFDDSGSGVPLEPLEEPQLLLSAGPRGVTAPVRIRGLKLSGPRRDYIVDFTDTAGMIMPFALIAGEISTGKTTIFEFIDYCLGASQHPEHPEIINNVRTAQLAVEILEHDLADADNDAAPTLAITGSPRLVQYVIERSVGGRPSKSAMLYRGDHRQLMNESPRLLTLDPADVDSLSQFLLRATGMAGLRIRVAPTKSDSKTHILSFRDIMPLCFLTNRRLESGDLVLERDIPKTLKLRQVVDYVFDVADEESSMLSEQIAQLRQNWLSSQASLKALRSFLIQAGVPAEAAIEGQVSDARQQARVFADQLDRVTANQTASTSFAENARNAYYSLATEARGLTGQVRERETLLARLTPLRSQYADDLRKLDLLEESQRLFDALSVTVCPACQTSLGTPAAVLDGNCTLCHSYVPHLRHQALRASGDLPTTDTATTAGRVNDDTAVLTVERRSVKRRLSELKGFIDEVDAERARLNSRLVSVQAGVALAQQRLDEATSVVVAPFITERDQLTAQIAALNSRVATLGSQLAMQKQILEREREFASIGSALAQARMRLRALEQSRQVRDDVLLRLSSRFSRTLTDFGFPKLESAAIGSNLVPTVRGLRYDRIGSSGAMTLIALAWQLTVFEEAVEFGHGHPGFLLIDSPQKNLRRGTITQPNGTQSSDEADINSRATTIVDRIYRHIRDWLARNPGAGQIMMVDNEPPSTADDYVVVRYSGDVDAPPYGLITDATD